MPSPHLYINEGRALGRDAETLARAVAYDRVILSNNVYPVLTLRHLARETGAEWGYLRSIVERRLSDYSSIRRRKQDGTFREISAPNPELMHVQRWILSRVLTGLRIHEAAFAYRRGLSIKDCAEVHLGARWLLKMDLHDFFGSIYESRIYTVLRGLGYPALMAFEMTRICTRVMAPPEWKPWLSGRGVEAYGAPYQGVLPQGGPTSGALANAVAFDLDTVLTSIANQSGMVYTRYSDDLTFSSPQALSRSGGSKLVGQIELAISRAGFNAHRGKTRIVTPGARQIVLGLMLTPEAVRLVPEFRHALDNHIRCVERYGPVAHAKERRFDATLSMINHVDGCLAFAIDIEPGWTAERKFRWESALAKHGHPVDQDV